MKRGLMPLHIPPHVHVREPSTVRDTVENSWDFQLNLIASISLAAEIIFFSNAIRRLLYNEYYVPPRLSSSLSADGLQLHGNMSDMKDWLQLYRKELSKGQEGIGYLTSLERTPGEESSKFVEISEALISVLASLERNGYQHLSVDGQPSTSGAHLPGFSVSDLIQALSKLSDEYRSFWEKYHSSPGFPSAIEGLAYDIEHFRSKVEEREHILKVRNQQWSGSEAVPRTVDQCQRFLEGGIARFDKQQMRHRVQAAQYPFDENEIRRLRRQILMQETNVFQS